VDKNIEYVLPWNATSDWQIYENILFKLLKNTNNFGDHVEVQMRYVSLEERNFTQLRLPDLFKNDDYAAPNVNFTNVMGYLLTRVKVKARSESTNVMKKLLNQEDYLNINHSMIKHLINKMGGEMCILTIQGHGIDVYFGVKT